MWQNYVVLAFRNFRRNQFPAILNLMGLSVAIGTTLVVYASMTTLKRLDSCHEKADRVFTVHTVQSDQGTTLVWGNSPLPLGPALAADFPQVERAVRVALEGAAVAVDGNYIPDQVWFVDDGFLDIFTFPLKRGDKNALKEPGSVILSEETARKYFGEEDPLGQSLVIAFGNGREELFLVRGVAKRFPREASFRFTLLINYQRQFELGVGAPDRWGWLTESTFLLLRNPEDAAVLQARMKPYIDLHNAGSRLRARELRLVNLRALSRVSPEFRGRGIVNGMHEAGTVLFPIIAFSLMALACLNYMNSTIASAATRLKEIGVRKIVGARRSQFIVQFFVENLVLTTAALVIGIAVAEVLLLPQFNTLFPNWPRLVFSFADDPGMWLFILGILFVTALISSSYPAIYVSSFRPLTIFSGRQRFGGAGLVARGLLIIQFVLAFFTMNGGVIAWLNAQYFRNADWGYHFRDTLILSLDQPEQLPALTAELHGHPDIMDLAGARDVVFGNSLDRGLIEGVERDINRYVVSPAYPATLGLRLKEGRFFDEGHPGDLDRAALVSELFVQTAGWNEPIGQQFRVGGKDYTVIGVVENFYHSSFNNPMLPCAFTTAAEETFTALTLRVRPGTEKRVQAIVEATCRRFFPDNHIRVASYETLYAPFFDDLDNGIVVLSFTALMALLLACVGLYGLASQDTARRMKEICLRKILGASTFRLGSILGRNFIALAVVAAVIALPIAYQSLGALLDSTYRYHMAITVWPFVLAFVLVLFTMALTVMKHLWTIATTNPVDILRSE